jgi:hypothetical protein
VPRPLPHVAQSGHQPKDCPLRNPQLEGDLLPGQRDRMIAKGNLKEDVEFEVRRYNETGPP